MTVVFFPLYLNFGNHLLLYIGGKGYQKDYDYAKKYFFIHFFKNIFKICVKLSIKYNSTKEMHSPNQESFQVGET